jgi:hypothetical protein
VDGETSFENDEIILGMYFFTDDQKVEHKRKVYNLLDLLSQTGGIATSLIAGIGFFVSIVNYYVYVMHFMHLLYFVWEEKQEGDADSSFINSLNLTSRL